MQILKKRTFFRDTLYQTKWYHTKPNQTRPSKIANTTSPNLPDHLKSSCALVKTTSKQYQTKWYRTRHYQTKPIQTNLFKTTPNQHWTKPNKTKPYQIIKNNLIKIKTKHSQNANATPQVPFWRQPKKWGWEFFLALNIGIFKVCLWKALDDVAIGAEFSIYFLSLSARLCVLTILYMTYEQ